MHAFACSIAEAPCEASLLPVSPGKAKLSSHTPSLPSFEHLVDLAMQHLQICSMATRHRTLAPASIVIPSLASTFKLTVHVGQQNHLRSHVHASRLPSRPHLRFALWRIFSGYESTMLPLPKSVGLSRFGTVSRKPYVTSPCGHLLVKLFAMNVFPVHPEAVTSVRPVARLAAPQATLC